MTILKSTAMPLSSSRKRHYHSIGYFNEAGRSLTEMMGTLAIMGILAVAGIWMYNSAMDRLKANTIINEAQKRAVVVAGQIGFQDRTDPSLGEFSENEFAGGTFSTNVITNGLYKQFGIQVSGVPKAICQNILNTIGESTSLRRLNLPSAPTMSFSACTDNNTFLMIYNNDLKGESGDPSYTCTTDTDCATLCGTCGEDHQCVGECPAEVKTCSADSECRQEGVLCAGCNQQMGMCQSCQPVAYLESTGTQYIDTSLKYSSSATYNMTVWVDGGATSGSSLFGARDAVNDNAFALFYYGSDRGLYRFDFGVGTASSVQNVTEGFFEGGWCSISIENRNVTFNEDKTIQTITATLNNTTTTYNLFLLGVNTGGTNTNAIPTKRVSKFMAYNNGILVRDFVPVHAPFKEANKQNCMFDKVSGELFCNATTGADFKTNLD